MGSKLRGLLQLIRWGLLAGATSTLTWAVDGLPAAAGELNDWSYNSQARSLTLTVPSDILPSVSVISPDQLLIELPNTQIGNVPSLTVGDGIVDSIDLEQISSETLWVVMEFAQGTVLSGTQSAVPVGEATAGQRWEVRPNLIASNGSTLNAASSEPTPTINSGGADSLRTPEVNVAQADFPDLPILEPRITLSEPVSVPPIESLPSPTPPPSPVAEASRSTVSVPSIPAESIPAESIQTASPEEVATEANLPTEPPFLGEETFEVPVIDRTELSSSESNSEFDSESNGESDGESEAETEVAEESAADEPVADATVENATVEDVAVENATVEDVAAENATLENVAVAEERQMTAEETPAESVAAIESEPAVVADTVPGDAVATVPGLQTRVDASFAEEPTSAEGEPKPEEIDFAAQGIVPQNTNRWPEPIPFGEPLPR